MQTPDRTGIICDKCFTSFHNDFVYYSYDLRKCSVFNNNRLDMAMVMSDPIIDSIDICTRCHGDIEARILSTYQSNMTQRVQARKYDLCEWSGKKLSGTYNYYYCVISKIDVRMSKQPYTCTNCKHQQSDNKVCSKCNNNKFVKIANTNVTPRLLEALFSEESYSDFKKPSNVQNTQWTTQS